MTLNERESAVFFHTYKRIPLEIDRAAGVYLFDSAGKKYLDFFGGLAVNALGHGDDRIISAIERQIKRYTHLSNYYLQDVQIEIAERLTRMSGYPRVFLSNTGAEANEGALKLARKWGATHGKHHLVGCTNSFHGRTFATLSLMDNAKYRAGIEPLVGDTQLAQFNSEAELAKHVDEHTAAVIFEPIQGEGGVVAATQAFLDEMMELRDQFNFLIIADEIQCGLGRTGKLFACEHYGLKPDIITIAKSLGGGLPLGAILGNDRVAEVWQPGEHGTTFGGNPVACAAGSALLDALTDGVMNNVESVGVYLHLMLHELKAKFPKIIKEVRGIGLMAGLKLEQEGDPIVAAMRENGVLINCTNTNVLRFLPPLVITKQDVDTMIATLTAIMQRLPE